MAKLTINEIQNQQLAKQFSLEYLERYKRQITARFAFEGDEDFTKRKQRLFFQSAFVHPFIGVQKIPKVGILPGGIQISKVVPSAWNLDNSIKQATMIKAVPHALTNTNPTYKEEDTVVFSYFSSNLSTTRTPQGIFLNSFGKLIEAIFYELISMIPNETQKILFKQTSTQLKQHQVDIANPQKKSINITQGDTDSGIGITPDQASTAANNQVSKLDLRSETFKYVETMDKLMTQMDGLLGQRTSTVYKQTQASQKEIADATASIFVFEREMLTTFEIFIEEYNEKFNTNLVLVDYLQAYMLEEKERENTTGEVDDPTQGTLLNEPESEA